MISFDKIPNVGTTLQVDGQDYELRQVRPHVRQDGGLTQLLVWESNCANCSEPFCCTTPVKSNGINRRCSECAKSGKPVKGKRGRKVTVKVNHA